MRFCDLCSESASDELGETCKDDQDKCGSKECGIIDEHLDVHIHSDVDEEERYEQCIF